MCIFKRLCGKERGWWGDKTRGRETSLGAAAVVQAGEGGLDRVVAMQVETTF